MRFLILVAFIALMTADEQTDKVIDAYKAEITKAGAAYDQLVAASTLKATRALEALQGKAKDEEAKAAIGLTLTQLNLGGLAPAVVDPRRFDLEPTRWTQLTELALDGKVTINARSGIVEVDPNTRTLENSTLGYFKAGTLVSVKSIGGAFRLGKGPHMRALVDGDAPGAVCIMWTADVDGFKLRKGEHVQPLPGRTATNPYLYKVPKDGYYALQEGSNQWGDNSGLAAFEIKLGGG